MRRLSWSEGCLSCEPTSGWSCCTIRRLLKPCKASRRKSFLSWEHPVWPRWSTGTVLILWFMDMRITERLKGIPHPEFPSTMQRFLSCRRSNRLWCTKSLICNFQVQRSQNPSTFLVKIVRAGFGLGDEQRQHAFGFYRDHIVLILQDTFDGEESF